MSTTPCPICGSLQWACRCYTDALRLIRQIESGERAPKKMTPDEELKAMLERWRTSLKDKRKQRTELSAEIERLENCLLNFEEQEQAAPKTDNN